MQQPLVEFDLLGGFADVLLMGFQLPTFSFRFGAPFRLELSVFSVGFFESKPESLFVRFSNFLQSCAIEPNPVADDCANSGAVG